jgi:predicted amidohydrolase
MKKPFRIAVAQLSISSDIKKNGSKVREQMCQAADGEARLIQFPEGTLSGYAKNQITDWSEVNWRILKEELEAITNLLPS